MAASDLETPGGNPKVSVFVSYAHEDRPRAQAVITVLERAGFQVWWDSLIVAGTPFASTTEQALEAASAVVVLWSRDSIASHWVRDEATVGRDRARLVPASLDGSEPPIGFRQYLFIDLSKWRGKADAPEIQAVVQAVQAAVDSKPPPDPRLPSAAEARGRMRRRLLIGGGSLALATAGSVWFARRRGLIGAPEVDANGVAVLPFTNLSGDPGQAYFSDGLSAEVRSALARNNRLRVIAQVSCDSFRDAKASAVTIAQTLGVAHLLDGNVRLSGKTFRIAAELIDGRTGFSQWAQTFDRTIEDIFAVQSEIAGSVVSALTTQMARATGSTEPPEVRSGGTTNVAAFDAYLRGRASYNLSEGESSDRQALAEFDAAIAADPKFAAAHAARSRTLLVIANQYADVAHAPAMYDAAVEAAETARALAPDLADAESTLAFVLFQGRLDVRGARAHYDRSRQLGEGDATVMGRFALYCAQTGRASEAEPAMARALNLDPLNPLVHRAMGGVLYAAHRYADAMPHIDRALALRPKLSGAHAALGSCLLMLGRIAESRDMYLAETHDSARLTGLAIVEHRLGNEAAARSAMDKLIAALGDSGLYQQAEVHAQWGERDAAMAVLRRARALGDSGLIYVHTDPLLDPLRSLLEFRELLSQLGFD
jgi:TolB-like protein/tetratricopeptide (TPR) repeat protein